MAKTFGSLLLIFLLGLCPPARGQTTDAPPSLERHYEVLASSLKDGQYSAAISLIRDAYETFTANQRAFALAKVNLASIHYALNVPLRRWCLNVSTRAQHRACLDLIDLILGEHPDNYFVRYTLAAVKWVNGDLKRGFAIGARAYKDFEKSIGGPPESVPIDVPLEGGLKVTTGWDSKKTHYHAGLWRYAMDLIVLNRKGRNASKGELVLAPVDGKVVETYEAGKDTYMVIAKEDDLRVALVHLMPGSFRVEQGHEVKAGDPVATVGDANHLHLQVSNKQNVSLPFVFNVWVDDRARVRRDSVPKRGKRFVFIRP